MYESKTKRLRVEAPADDTRAQHLSSSPSAATTTGLLQQSTSSPTSVALSGLPQTSTTTTGTLARRGSKSSPIGGSVASATNDPCSIRDSSSGSFIMTAPASGNLAGNENESPVKASANTPSYSSHRENSQMLPGRQQLGTPPEDVNTTRTSATFNTGQNCTSEQQLIDRLANETLEEARLELILSIRNLITACNKKKVSLVNNPSFAKIIRIIDDEKHASSEVKAQLALLLCSVAKGGEHNVRVLNDSFVDDKIFYLILGSKDDALIEACLRCMRAIMSWPKVSRHCMLYDKYPRINPQQPQNTGPKRIIDYARSSQSHIVQECVADIFAATCNRSKDQALLFNSGALSCIVQLLESQSHRVILASLNWLSTICFMNPMVSLEAINSQCPSGTMLLDRLVQLMSKDECVELQFSSAKCCTRIYKVLGRDHFGEDSRIVMQVLSTLVRMVHKDKSSQLRSEAASTIATLIEGDTKLQETASVCDHLIESLAHMLEYESHLMSDIRDYSSQLLHANDREIYWKCYLSERHNRSSQLLDLSNIDSMKQLDFKSDKKYSECIHEMKRSAFQALAALASNQETIRKKIFDSCAVMQHLIKGLSDSDPRTLKSVLICLLSLSRSVHQLRTSFAENTVYSGLKNLLLTKSNDILNLVLMILCNISLDFSPGKQHFLDSATIAILCNLTHSNDQSLRLHSMWILMNMAYMLKDLDLKFQIFKTITPEHVFSILETEDQEMLLLKTLGFLRNLLSQRSHIDEIMNNHGEPIIQSLLRLLNRPCSRMVKEQAICVLTNIADGNEAKSMIMNNVAILRYLATTICDEEAGDLRLAAICCITNLAHKDQEGSQSRQNEMKSLGIQDKLKSMLNTMDPILSDRVRTAYNQFLLSIDDKYVK
uniref:Armadillo repeat-containing protein 8 n=1 Tax=Aceria tosichella TaxID=561515 RepID=A0A6G1SPC3_9ACAR